MFRRCQLVACVFLLSCMVFAGKKPNATLVKLPPQTVELKDFKAIRAKQPCPNWAWAAIVEMMLAHQDVPDMTQTDWILKANAGEVCIETPVDLESVKRVIDGDYVLLANRKVHIETVVTPGAPSDVGYLIQNVQAGNPLLLLWHGRPMAVQAIEYDEYIYPNNQRMYEVLKLTMVDPVTGKTELFDKAKDSPSEIGGALEVRVSPLPF
jgi:hypothetical protein